MFQKIANDASNDVHRPPLTSTGARVDSFMSGPEGPLITCQSLALSHSFLVKYIVLPTPVCGVFCPCYARCIPKQELISQFLKNKTRIRLN